LHALAGHLAKLIGEAVSNGDAGDLPEPIRIAPASAASFQAVAHGGEVHDVEVCKPRSSESASEMSSTHRPRAGLRRRRGDDPPEAKSACWPHRVSFERLPAAMCRWHSVTR
jgi:hypothetical protein